MSTPASTVTDWTVTGMTCHHCVASVTEELSEVEGVQAVDVALDTGVVTVTSSRPLERSEVEAAVTEAGYTLA
ncbi:MAG: heavy metal-associated domain-containing protein [Nocardioides sp.]